MTNIEKIIKAVGDGDDDGGGWLAFFFFPWLARHKLPTRWAMMRCTDELQLDREQRRTVAKIDPRSRLVS
jgi:hypothetical protein